MMNPNVMHHMAQARRADLLREAEECRRARMKARPTVLIRITAQILRLRTRSRRRMPSAISGSTSTTREPDRWRF
jgi:hypothetical protein